MCARSYDPDWRPAHEPSGEVAWCAPFLESRSPRPRSGLSAGGGADAGAKCIAVLTGAVLVLFTLACAAPPAHAQLDALGPAFSKLNGALIWGSAGYRDTRHPERFYTSDRHPVVHGGVSAQHIRWSAIRYRAPSEQSLADAALRRLPDGLRLTTVHAILGVGFDASKLFAR